MPLRCTRYLLPLALSLTAYATPAAAISPNATVSHVALRAPANALSTPKIGIDGDAPAGCLPKVSQVLLDGSDLSIALTASATGCKSRHLPFHLDVDPNAAGTAGALPEGAYRVRVYQGAGATTRLVAFALIDTSSGMAAPTPENGFWWTQATSDNTAVPGTGMSLEFQDNQIAASLLGFTPTGAPTWYFGSAALSGRVAHVPLVQLGKGEEWFAALGSQPEVQAGPRLEIEFLSPTRAEAYLVRSDDAGTVQTRSLTLSRSAFTTGPAGSPWIGRWVLVPEDGGGSRVFDFSAPTSRDAESFRLTDAANDAALDCRFAAGTQQADACTLTTATTVVADFDQVGFDRFTGRGANGAPVQMLRVSR